MDLSPYKAVFFDAEGTLYRRHLTQVQATPGLNKFLEQIRAKGLPIAIVTSAGQQGLLHSLEQIGPQLGKDFDFAITYDDVTQSKPHPEPYLKALERLGLKGKEVLVFEDSPSGVRAAEQAGCDVLQLGLDLDNFEPATEQEG